MAMTYGSTYIIRTSCTPARWTMPISDDDDEGGFVCLVPADGVYPRARIYHVCSYRVPTAAQRRRMIDADYEDDLPF